MPITPGSHGGLKIGLDEAAFSAGAWSEETRRHFERHHWCRLPHFLSPPLLSRVQEGIATATFVGMRHEAVQPPSVDLAMTPNATAAMLELCCNDPIVLAAIETLTGCAPLRSFGGFVYRLAPGTGLHHNWHSDCVNDRRVALSINVDTGTFEGGSLRIRDAGTGMEIEQADNQRPGDALLFRIDERLQHRVMPVTSGVKTAFAGWFSGAGSLLGRLRGER